MTQSNPPSWGLDRIDETDLPRSNSYSYTTTGSGVNVYIIDTGIRRTHTQFGGRAFVGFDAVGDGQNTTTVTVTARMWRGRSADQLPALLKRFDCLPCACSIAAAQALTQESLRASTGLHPITSVLPWLT